MRLKRAFSKFFLFFLKKYTMLFPLLKKSFFAFAAFPKNRRKKEEEREKRRKKEKRTDFYGIILSGFGWLGLFMKYDEF